MTSASLIPDRLDYDQFTVQAFDTTTMTASQLAMPYRQRSAYKISLYTGGTALVQYAGQTLTIGGADLLFFNPLLPYSCQQQTGLTGFYCEFTNAFLSGVDRSASLQESPLFRLGANPRFHLDPDQTAWLSETFRRMLADLASGYRHKYELLRTHVQQVVHVALRLQSNQDPPPPPGPATRLAARFLQLLERQFPVASPTQPLALHSAQAFAAQLGVQVNHLNRVVRAATGRTTSGHLAERIAQEAQALLRHTDWPIADIAQGLGFAEATYFNRFFRKQTGISPKAFRQQC
ncbi:helix-turn-helix transcriptional regulator [Hymenobacter sp. RP-2-7]|uniref:Helix-turn-helix transcriptional regulator n=1 Tax=Hymenobacter polaris TaxID=2682546 RepID=A0A7Y0AII7_9BACT|nr:helix-turn-helix transcriptional regulator [Hymenobacter polaris]NML67983.1 helix-turn-helix transcriptional regulator [Hymenobacter polaris]